MAGMAKPLALARNPPAHQPALDTRQRPASTAATPKATCMTGKMKANLSSMNPAGKRKKAPAGRHRHAEGTVLRCALPMGSG
ncbi:hypothetical protein GCM10019060_04290 [Novosphingobium pokkalii]|nr:hypothetical protein GCM10019060_04290 [Novosphingobium pokkalii]